MAAGYPDELYAAKGAQIGLSRADLVRQAELFLLVRGHEKQFDGMRSGQTIVGFLDPLGSPATMVALGNLGVHAFAMELMPRITRAQSMDALTSAATRRFC